MDSALLPELAAAHLRPMAPIPTALSQRGALRPPVRCLLCDIYGTLLISGSGDPGSRPVRHDATEVLQTVLTRHGVAMAPAAVAEGLRQAIDRRHAAARGRGVDFPEVDIEAIWREVVPSADAQRIRRLAIEYEMVVNPVWPMPHLTELLAFRRHNDIRLGIVSNAQFFTPGLLAWFLGAPVEQLGFDPDLIFWSYRHGVAKPSPLLFQMAAEALVAKGIAPDQTAYVGNDLRKDILPAARIGLQTVLFAGDARSLRLEVPGTTDPLNAPDLIVTDLSRLIRCLEAAK